MTGHTTHGISITVKEEVDISLVLSFKYLKHQRRAALKILSAFRHWKKMSKSALRWTSIIQKDSSRKRKKEEVSVQSLQLASESYQHMIENSDLGDIIIVEQC